MTNVKSKMLCCAFSPKGRAVTGHVDGDTSVWDLETGDLVYHFQHKEARVTAVDISRDGSLAFAALSDHSVYLYRLPPPDPK